jgi:heptosyltransferase II
MLEMWPARRSRGLCPQEPQNALAPRRVLVKEVNWLGDLVMSIPALRVIRYAFPEAQLSVLIRSELAGFFDGIEWIDEVISYTTRRGTGRIMELRRIVGQIRERHFDLGILFPNSFSSALWMWMAGVPRRVGYATDRRRFLLTDWVAPRPEILAAFQGQYWIGLLRETLRISPAPDGVEARLKASPQSIARIRSWLEAKRRHPNCPLIAVAPAAAYGPAKEWPPASYAALVDLLAARGAECVLVGAPSEQVKCAQIASMAKAGVIVAAGATNVTQLNALLSLCDGFAGNDSGAMHLAAAVGIPTVGIFGSTNPARTGPQGLRAVVIYHHLDCSPCLKRTCRFGHYECLRGIEPAEVIAALERAGALRQ